MRSNKSRAVFSVVLGFLISPHLQANLEDSEVTKKTIKLPPAIKDTKPCEFVDNTGARIPGTPLAQHGFLNCSKPIAGVCVNGVWVQFKDEEYAHYCSENIKVPVVIEDPALGPIAQAPVYDEPNKTNGCKHGSPPNEWYLPPGFTLNIPAEFNGGKAGCSICVVGSDGIGKWADVHEGRECKKFLDWIKKEQKKYFDSQRPR
jgi:hypothetical protein